SPPGLAPAAAGSARIRTASAISRIVTLAPNFGFVVCRFMRCLPPSPLGTPRVSGVLRGGRRGQFNHGPSRACALGLFRQPHRPEGALVVGKGFHSHDLLVSD